MRNTGFRAWQRLARTGKNLTRLGSRRRRPGGNRNAARRCVGNNRLPGRKRRTQGRGSRRGSRRRLCGNFPRGQRRRLDCCFVLGRACGSLDSRTGIGCVPRLALRRRRGGTRRSLGFPGQPALDFKRNRFIDRTGVGFFLGDAQLREHIEDHVRLHLEFAGQLVYTNFDHTVCPAVQLRHRGCQINPAPYPESPRLPEAPQYLS